MREVFDLNERYGPVDPVVRAEISQQLDIAQKLYDLRTERGLSEADVAKLVGTSVSVILRMEDADYDLIKSVENLERFTNALDCDSSGLMVHGRAAPA